MSHVYLVTVRADHDFGNVIWRQAFVSRPDAQSAATGAKEQALMDAESGEPDFGSFRFSSTIEAIPLS